MGTSRQVFIDEQKAATSRGMTIIKDLVDKPRDDGPAIYQSTPDGLITMKDGKLPARVVVPESLRKFVLEMYHNNILSGHQGRRRTMQQVAATFFWPGMASDVKRWVRACLAWGA